MWGKRMFKKFVSVCIVLGLSVGTFGSVGCGGGTEDMSKDTTPPPAKAPANEKMDAELPPDA